MATLHHNISGTLTQELLAAGNKIPVSMVSFANTGSGSCRLDLYIEKKTVGKFYLLKGLNIPAGNTYIYSGVVFDNRSNEFGLYMKLNGTSPTMDVIIS